MDNKGVAIFAILIAIASWVFFIVHMATEADERRLWCKAIHSETELYLNCLHVGVKSLEE